MSRTHNEGASQTFRFDDHAMLQMSKRIGAIFHKANCSNEPLSFSPQIPASYTTPISQTCGRGCGLWHVSQFGISYQLGHRLVEAPIHSENGVETNQSERSASGRAVGNDAK